MAVCNSQAAWSPRKKAEVIRDILENKKSYYVQERTRRSYVRVVDGDKLRTTQDAENANCLENLGDA